MNSSKKSPGLVVGMCFLITILWSYLPVRCDAQGEFLASNASAPTRLGTIDGPFAGPGIWGQFLAGPTVESLQPIGVSMEHYPNGAVAGMASVAGVPCGAIAQVQMVAWDGTIWGTSLAGVPANQLGRTDIVPVNLSCDPFPFVGPSFTRAAVVPPVPEPSTWGLIALSALWTTLRLSMGRRAR